MPGKQKMSIEKKMIIAIVVILIATVLLISNGLKKIKATGGFKQIAIEAGKEVKDIQKEVSDYKPE